MKLSQQKEQIIANLLAKLKTLPKGTEISTAELFSSVYPAESLDTGDFFELNQILQDRSKKVGLFFDSSKYWQMCVGLPFNIPFLVTPRKPDLRFDCIQYEEFNSSGMRENLMIDLPGRRIFYFAGQDNTKTEPVSYHCSPKQWRQIMELVRAAAFPQWEDEYGKQGSRGIEWELLLLRGGRIRKKSSGSNTFPPAWQIFRELKQITIQLMKQAPAVSSKPEGDSPDGKKHPGFSSCGNLKST